MLGVGGDVGYGGCDPKTLSMYLKKKKKKKSKKKKQVAQRATMLT